MYEKIIGNLVTDLHNVINKNYDNKNERNKAIKKIVTRIYKEGYEQGYGDSGRDEQGF